MRRSADQKADTARNEVAKLNDGSLHGIKFRPNNAKLHQIPQKQQGHKTKKPNGRGKIDLKAAWAAVLLPGRLLTAGGKPSPCSRFIGRKSPLLRGVFLHA